MWCHHNWPICEAVLAGPTGFHTAAPLSIIEPPVFCLFFFFCFEPSSYWCRTHRQEHLQHLPREMCRRYPSKCLTHLSWLLSFLPLPPRLTSARKLVVFFTLIYWSLHSSWLVIIAFCHFWTRPQDLRKPSGEQSKQHRTEPTAMWQCLWIKAEFLKYKNPFEFSHFSIVSMCL